MSYLGDLLKKRRNEKGISQNHLAKKMGWSNGQLVSTYERGECYPPLGSVKKIAKLVGATKDEIMSAWTVDMQIKMDEELR